MHAMQASIGQAEGVTIMMWNPPWTALLLSPFLGLPFEAAAIFWLLANFVLIGVIAVLTPNALGFSQLPTWLCGLAVCFLPLFDCLQMGQLSIVLTCGFILFMHFARTGNYFACGLTTVILSMKPHLFLLCGIPGAIWLYQIGLKQARTFLCAAGGGFLTALLGACVFAPLCITWWLSGLEGQQLEPGVVPVRLWQSATLATVIRIFLERLSGSLYDWPLWVMPLLGLGVVAVMTARAGTKIDWATLAPRLLPLCFIFSSYGWLFDQSLLVICNFAILGAAWTSKSALQRLIGIGGVILIQLGMLMINARTSNGQHYYFWLPLALLALLWVCKRRQGNLRAIEGASGG
jgi:hypothetical protein